MEHKNSHNLKEGDILICIKSKDAVWGSYFVEGRKYRVLMEGLNQTEQNEIFVQDMEFDTGIKYIKDKKFKKYFKLDIKTNRKQKLKKILKRNNG